MEHVQADEVELHLVGLQTHTLEALAHGLACYPMGGTIDGKHGDHVILSPPYIVTARDVEMIVERFGTAVDEVFANLPGAF